MKHYFSLTFVFLVLFHSVATAQQFPVRERLEPYVSGGELPGMVTVVATKDRIVQLDAIGYADVETKRPMTAETVFWMASQTKPVTAVAVMILVEEGKLSLDEPVTTYLPELKNLLVVSKKEASQTVLVPPERPITLRKLLSHTGGTLFLTPLQEKFGIDMLSSPRALVSYIMTPLAHQPDTKYLYSNIGINIAATVVERVSGMPLETFFETRIFQPLGMKETTFWPTSEQIERLAKPYRLDAEKKALAETRIRLLTYPLDNREIRFPEGGGGLFSTPNDWVRFYQMLVGEGSFNGKRILSPESVRIIRTKQTGDLPNSYGLCVNIIGNAFGHGGSHGTNSIADPDSGFAFLYLIQEAGLPKAGEAQKSFFKAVRGK